MSIALIRNASWAETVTLLQGNPRQPFPLQDYVAEMHFRDAAASPTSAPVLTLTTAPGGGLAYTSVSGRLTVSLTEAQVNAFAFAQGTYQLKVTTLDGSYSAVLMSGGVFINPV